MMHGFSLRHHPFKFLLYLEWILLVLALLSQLLPHPRWGGIYVSSSAIVATVGFGLMGLWLPRRDSWGKWIYLAIALGLSFFTTSPGFRRLQPFPLLYLILVVRCGLIFSKSQQIIITAIIYVLSLILMIRRLQWFELPPDMPPPPPGPPMHDQIGTLIINYSISFAILYGLALVFVMLMVNTLVSERQSREKLAEANEQLRRYAMQVENLAMAQERNRIAREIHDSLGHSLTALNIQLEGALKLGQVNPTQAHIFLQDAKRMGSIALQEVRASVARLRRDPLQGTSLSEAIAQLSQDFQRTTGMNPQVDINLTHELPNEMKICIYRIVQEALTNIAKHAHATQVDIQLLTTTLGVTLSIRDNGTGFWVSQNQSGFGLQGMRERTLALAGHFEVTSAPGQGCWIQAEFPITSLTV